MTRDDNVGGYTLDYIPCTNRAHYYRARQVLLFDRGKFCAKCGSLDSIEAHHIDGDITNCDLDNLEWLCRSCHEELHGLR